MFFVAGITGHIGGATAQALLARGKTVRSLVRDPSKAKSWAERGVDLQSGDLIDPDALSSALEGVEAAFLMQPTPMGVTRDFPEAHALTVSLVAALRRTPPPRAVVLSSVGSEQASGLGNITQTHILEKALTDLSVPLAVLRPGALLENNVAGLAIASATGQFDSFLQPIDQGFPMVATVDVGAEIARLLVEGWEGRKIIEVGSYVSPQELAAGMGEALGRVVTARALPRDEWRSRLGKFGLKGEQIDNWEEMQDGFNSRWIDFGRPGTERTEGSTDPAAFFRQALEKQGLLGSTQQVVAEAATALKSVVG